MSLEEVTAGSKRSGALKGDGAVCPGNKDLKLWVHRATGTRIGQTLDLPGEEDRGTSRKGCEGEFTAPYSGQ